MSEFRIKYQETLNMESGLKGYAGTLLDISSSITSVRNSLSFEIQGRERIAARLREISGTAERHGRCLRSFGDNLGRVKDRYFETEQHLSGLEGASLTEILFPGGNSPGAEDTPSTGGEIGGHVSSFESEYNSGDVSNSLMAEIISGNLTASAEASFYSDGRFDPHLKAEASAEGSVLKIKDDLQIGAMTNHLEVGILTASAVGAVSASIFNDDGLFSPSIQASASVEGSVVNIQDQFRYGNDEVNIHAEREADLLYGKAEASGAAGVFTETDDSGNTVTKIGVKGEAGAEAYLAQGTVSGGFELFGLKINLSATGKVGGAGVTAGGEVTTGGVSGSFGIGLLAGLELGFSIEW